MRRSPLSFYKFIIKWGGIIFMKDSLDEVLCALIRVALGLSQDFSYILDENDWRNLLAMAKQQTVLGVVYNAFSRLSVNTCPRSLTMRLAMRAESIHGVNRVMNQEAKRYTQLFAERGIRSVILKGQANARLYPDPVSRQAGDIDIWIPGGYDGVEKLLIDMGIIAEGNLSYKVSHHIAFHNENGIEIEIHHRPADVPFRNNEFQAFLQSEFANSTLTPEGFYAPNIRFALVMQLRHLYSHCLKEGIGLRHYMDYFMLLKHSNDADRKFVWEKVKRFGMANVCGGVMWVLEKAFGLPSEMMLCSPDKNRGLRLYKNTIAGGNFGRNDPKNDRSQLLLSRWFKDRIRAVKWFGFDPLNIVLSEIRYWKDTISLVPERLRRGKLFLR